MGLKKSFQIGKIVIHPKKPDIVYVGALGRLYGPNPERGLFKTTDGGKTWEKVLFVDDKTGVIDIAMHPTDPETLHRGDLGTPARRIRQFPRRRQEARKARTNTLPPMVHGPGGGLYRSTNGGKTFAKLTKGLPNANAGADRARFFPRNTPTPIFAIIDTEKAGMRQSKHCLPPNSGYLGVAGDDDNPEAPNCPPSPRAAPPRKRA